MMKSYTERTLKVVSMYLRGSEKTKPDGDLESVYHVVYSQA